MDYLRNAYAQTSVCPYSLRATTEMGIATPIKYNELDNVKKASQYNLNTIEKKIQGLVIKNR
ncbi:non-homologous end-joining DNA ligase LigD [Mesonia aquimarina]|uniref:non-homologous end-joining DNA ligase LigD n=1 Tax=Mesonia aquimarina TaxID=1504967 RepID=UPI003743AABB